MLLSMAYWAQGVLTGQLLQNATALLVPPGSDPGGKKKLVSIPLHLACSIKDVSSFILIPYCCFGR
jgi:hypothetical protein